MTTDIDRALECCVSTVWSVVEYVMLQPRHVLSPVMGCLMILAAGVACGQDYPSKPIRIVTGGAGGGNDIAARLLGQGLTASWGQPVIVDNRPSGVIPGEVAARATPDGYVLLLNGSSFWIAPLLQNVPYDTMKDFAPITLAVSSPNMIVVHPAVQATSIKDLVALAKAKPGALNYAAGGSGSANHLAAELFKAMAGINMVRISYKSTAEAITDLISGQVQLTFSPTSAVAPHVKTGRLRALAMTSANPSALAPELPTVSASGLQGYEAVAPYAIFAPAKTPQAIIQRLHQELVRILEKQDVKERLFNAGLEIVGSSPEQLMAAMKADVVRLGKVIRDAGIRAD